MAEIVFGVGTSHSPLLATKADQWHLRGEEDKGMKHHYRGGIYTFDELVQLRKDEKLADQLKPELMRQRDETNQKHLATLSEKIKAAKLDVLVVFGDDQYENLLPDNMPAFMVFNGKDIPFEPTSEERIEKMPPGVRLANWARVPEKPMTLPGTPDLANLIVSTAINDGFDLSVSDRIFDKPGGEKGIGHAFGFYYHRLMDDFREFPKLTTLPIYINTFFAPNQPPVKRVYEFGRSVGRAIRAWDKNLRVGIAASGGFSHFVIDEALDRKLLKALEQRDINTIASVPESHYQSGTSEIKNWIAAMGALESTHLKFGLVDYVPCYRSLAGTGNANAFGLWNAA